MTTPVASGTFDMRGHVMSVGHLAVSRPVTVTIHATTVGTDVFSTTGLYVELTVGAYSLLIPRTRIYSFAAVAPTTGPLTNVLPTLPAQPTVTLAELVPVDSGWTVSVVALP